MKQDVGSKTHENNNDKAIISLYIPIFYYTLTFPTSFVDADRIFKH